ncbi:hypothetical protein [Corallococcus llansteffanensis]|uniref:Uncharacterized protein n=1 Tax=Corallococcus llansteffanensis TaxID=2316731 RepID=A0A3A8PSZ9_9BACT|nr:hypothetical protein [Corallococcus llansteffanensis]RKH59596.1 hypothetical protein D7V93_14600 [Corallococcus llansteffanensis]
MDLPECWAHEAVRRREARIPADVPITAPDLASYLVLFYDGDPAAGGRLIASRQLHGLPAGTAPFREATAGPRGGAPAMGALRRRVPGVGVAVDELPFTVHARSPLPSKSGD